MTTTLKQIFGPSCKPKYTSRNNIHKVEARKDTYALTFRGPWLDYWYEVMDGHFFTLTHGGKVVSSGCPRVK